MRRRGPDRVEVAAIVVLILVFLLGLLVGKAGAYPVNVDRASYYGPGLYGNPVACGGARLQPWTIGVAHRSLRCGTQLYICRGRRCVFARVIDRGPFVAGRSLDLTAATAARLCGCRASSWGVRSVAWTVVR